MSEAEVTEIPPAVFTSTSHLVRRVESRGTSVNAEWYPVLPPVKSRSERRVEQRKQESDLQSSRVSGTVVSFDAIDLPEHDVLEGVDSRRRQVWVPLTVSRIPVLLQRRRDHQSELVSCLQKRDRKKNVSHRIARTECRREESERQVFMLDSRS